MYVCMYQRVGMCVCIMHVCTHTHTHTHTPQGATVADTADVGGSGGGAFSKVSHTVTLYRECTISVTFENV